MKSLFRWTLFALLVVAIGMLFRYGSVPNDVVAEGGYAWTETSSGKNGWTSMAASTDGQKLAVAAENGPLYTSEDGGATWTEQAGAGNRAWTSLAMSDDGSKLALTDFGGYIHLSDDGGVTWLEQGNAPQNQWVAIAMSGDGSVIVAAADSSHLYTTNDFGGEWTEHEIGETAWRALAVSQDGKTAYAAGGDKLFTSSNSGNDWAEQMDAGAREWTSIDISSDKTTIVGVARNSNIVITTDEGSSWNEIAETGERDWESVALSLDGQTVIAADASVVYVGRDSFTNWTEQSSIGSKNWKAVTISETGTHLAAVGLGSNVFTANNEDGTPPVISNISSGMPGAYSATITWTTDEGATSQVFYGPDTSYVSSTVLDADFTTNHSVAISGLVSSATYHFIVVSSDASGNTTTSTDQSFITLGMLIDEPEPEESQGEVDTSSDTVKSGSTQLALKEEKGDVCKERVTGTKKDSLVISRELTVCSRGDDVKVLQEFLIDKGYLVGESTGYFGSLTEIAVNEFKKDNDIKSDLDIVGPYTRALLYVKSLEAAGMLFKPTGAVWSPKPDPLSQTPAEIFTRDMDLGLTGADVVYLQKFLTDEGYLAPGNLSAYFDVQTQKALAAYQAVEGIFPAAGYFGPKTRVHIINSKTE